MKRYDYSKSFDWLERAGRVLASGVSSEFRKYNHPHALFYTHGEGTRLFDVDGNEYLDFTLSQGPLILGHSHPEILEAVHSYSRKGQLFAGQHAQEIELAEKIQRLIPCAERLRFCLDGSEAVQTALRVARSKTGKQKFLRFEGHYHGWLDNVCYGISTPSEEAMGERHAPVAHPWSQGLPEGSAEEFFLLPWNDLELVQELVKQQHKEVAAIIMEPIMCNNGCIPPREGFLQGLREICDRYGIALIFDEVITGFRLGLSGAQGYYDIVPDLSVFAKALGSGFPISVVVGKREWMEEITSARVIHAGTMNAANPTVAAALATVSILERENPYPQMFALGDRLRQGLQKAAKESSQPLLVSGIGPIVHTGFTDKKEVCDFRDVLHFDKGRLKEFTAGMHDRGLRVIGRGLWYISGVHTESEIDHAVHIAKAALTDMKS
jgi:glutamate-1-semialdehyde 2,1-aminomutase